MKIAISAMEPGLDSEVEARFGRSPHFVLINPENMQYETFENPNLEASGGAGISTAQLICEKGAETVITGRIGPKAHQVLARAGVRMLTGVSGKIRDVIERFKTGRLMSETGSGQAPAMGQGVETGRGRGTGMGRGMGCGGGRGMGKRDGRAGGARSACYWQPEPWSGGTSEMKGQDELDRLKKQAGMLADELARIRDRMEQMEKE